MTPPDSVKENQYVTLNNDERSWEKEKFLALSLFSGLADDGLPGVGVTRDSYGLGEQRAHDRIAALARDLGLEVTVDVACNLYITYPGVNRQAPVAMTGSHLDSVPCGGNFDGAAGVVAGMAIFARWRRLGYTPPHDCTVMGIRAEESAWFPLSYIGSKAAFGLLTKSALDIPRRDSNRTLAMHIADSGGDPDAVGRGEAYLDAAFISRFVELHIEQGPVLLREMVPVGLVTGIRGAFRFRHAKTIGSYAHSGAEQRSTRKDAVLDTAKLAVTLDRDWDAMEAANRDLVVTFGEFSTDDNRADFSKVSGEVRFTIDVRSVEENTLVEMESQLREHVRQHNFRHKAEIILGEITKSRPAVMDQNLRSTLKSAAMHKGISYIDIPSGAGHDTAMFATQGVPSAMIFVRNGNGSHNPEESMEIDDFILGTELLEDVLKVSGLEK